MMDQEQTCRLLNEGLANRTVTGAGFQVMSDDRFGEVFVPYFEVDNFIKVFVGRVSPRHFDAREFVSKWATHIGGKRVAGVLISTSEDADSQLFLCVVVAGISYPVWNLRVSSSDCMSHLSQAFANSGLQVPCRLSGYFWLDTTDDDDQDDDDQDDDDQEWDDDDDEDDEDDDDDDDDEDDEDEDEDED